jgi:hypothetical protein
MRVAEKKQRQIALGRDLPRDELQSYGLAPFYAAKAQAS